MHPTKFPFDNIRRQDHVRTLLSTQNRMRWQNMIQDDLVDPGYFGEGAEVAIGTGRSPSVDSQYQDRQANVSVLRGVTTADPNLAQYSFR